MKKLLKSIICFLFISWTSLAQAKTEHLQDDVVLTFMRYGKMVTSLSESYYRFFPNKIIEEFFSNGKKDWVSSEELPYIDLYRALTKQLNKRVHIDQMLVKKNNAQSFIEKAFAESENMHTLRNKLKDYAGLADEKYLFISEHFDTERFFQQMVEQNIEINSKNLKSILRSKFTTAEQHDIAFSSAYNNCIKDYLFFIEANVEILERISELAYNKLFTVIKDGKDYSLSPSEMMNYINSSSKDPRINTHTQRHEKARRHNIE